MTGLDFMWRGLSLTTESISALRTMVPLKVADRRLVPAEPTCCWGASGTSRVDVI